MASYEHCFNLGCVAGKKCKDFKDKARNSDNLWDSIHFLASLWAFCSKIFKGTPLIVLQLDRVVVCNSNGLV